MSKVSIIKVEHYKVREAVEKAMKLADYTKYIKKDGIVVVKPNICWDLVVPGAQTSPWVVEAVLEILKDRASEIYVVEGDSNTHTEEDEKVFSPDPTYLFLAGREPAYRLYLAHTTADVFGTDDLPNYLESNKIRYLSFRLYILHPQHIHNLPLFHRWNGQFRRCDVPLWISDYNILYPSQLFQRILGAHLQSSFFEHVFKSFHQ